ncbi:MAG: hypothetical protein JO166_19280 [Deltaproteobacteria bacterium]|nr:hypothetical protein [Deltaproteobacteria bacterium]
MAVGLRGVSAIGESEKALRCRLQGNEQRWVPKSQIQRNSEVKRLGNCGTLVVSDWWFARYQEESTNYREATSSNATSAVGLGEAMRIYRQLAHENRPDLTPKTEQNWKP